MTERQTIEAAVEFLRLHFQRPKYVVKTNGQFIHVVNVDDGGDMSIEPQTWRSPSRLEAQPDRIMAIMGWI